ncbi:hypothetical protein ElyMa_003188300 [Elysia marginata]|uniref:Uncharacterized protein n=1 Tax=Elysia marginata TaxID=1093978 RepID=A0AAV4J2G1_9GAST|nr:hypothetical protein ElyMa_003188300 [Elysia marginata]
MNKDLLTVEEQFLRLGVRTHLLEVELATQFSPDLLEDQEKANLTSQDCELVVEEERQRIENLSTANMETRGCNVEKLLQENVSIAVTKDDNAAKSVGSHELPVEEEKTNED